MVDNYAYWLRFNFLIYYYLDLNVKWKKKKAKIVLYFVSNLFSCFAYWIQSRLHCLSKSFASANSFSIRNLLQHTTKCNQLTEDNGRVFITFQKVSNLVVGIQRFEKKVGLSSNKVDCVHTFTSNKPRT